MADIDCNKDLRAYHSEKIILNKSSQDSMRTHRDAGRTRLKNGLTRLEKPHPQRIESQGSYSMKTMVQDDEYEYDIDDGVYFKPDDLIGFLGFRLAPGEVRQRVCDALTDDDRFTSPAEVRSNCVRQTYSKGYHIDYPVYRILTEKDEKGKDKEYFELASGDEWVRSDARAVTSWFNGKVTTLNSGDVNDGSQLRRVVRYTKKFARSRTDWKEKTASGITITKLVVDHFVPNEDRDDLAIRNTWKKIKKALDISTEVKHPVVAKNLAEKNDDKVIFFRDTLGAALEALEILDKHDCTRKKACDAWDLIFNTNYFSKRVASEESAAKSLLSSSTLAVAGLTFPDKPITPNKSAGFA